jgi:hypothetical protein
MHGYRHRRGAADPVLAMNGAKLGCCRVYSVDEDRWDELISGAGCCHQQADRDIYSRLVRVVEVIVTWRWGPTETEAGYVTWRSGYRQLRLYRLPAR